MDRPPPCATALAQNFAACSPRMSIGSLPATICLACSAIAPSAVVVSISAPAYIRRLAIMGALPSLTFGASSIRRQCREIMAIGKGLELHHRARELAVHRAALHAAAGAEVLVARSGLSTAYSLSLVIRPSTLATTSLARSSPVARMPRASGAPCRRTR
jgi:hypothetical protein